MLTISEYFVELNNDLNKIRNNIYIRFYHISLLDSATCMGKDLQVQEEINNKNDNDEPAEEIVSTIVATLEKSVTSSSASTKRKRKTKLAKASPKVPLVLEKKSVHKNYDKKDDQIEKNPKTKRTSKCPHVGMHQKRELMGLLEE